MKLQLTKFFVAAMLFALATTLPAQITIVSSDIDITFGRMYSQFSVQDSTGNGIAVNLGTAGGPNTWTFNESVFPNPESWMTTVVDPATTPFASTFTNSNHAWFSTIDDSGDVYFFLNKDANAYSLNGIGVVSGDTSVVLENNVPPNDFLPFPAQMGASWNNNSVSTLVVGPAVFIDSTVAQLSIDAYGTVVTPGGSFESLRVREDITCYSVFGFNGQVVSRDTTSEINYIWFAKDIGFIAEVTGRENVTNPNYTLADQVGWRVSTSTAIGQQPGTVANNFTLKQNYPNPFNPSTTISFDLAEANEVNLSVFTVTGQQIATLVNRRMPAGEHRLHFDAKDLPSGVYFYRLKAGSSEAVRRMTLTR